jgi:hypothetical protein
MPCLSPGSTRVGRTAHIDAPSNCSRTGRSRASLRPRFDVEIHRSGEPHPGPGGHDRGHGPGDGTAMLYGHLDKQPPLGDWSEGLGPTNRFAAATASTRGASPTTATPPSPRCSPSRRWRPTNIPHSRCVVLIEASEESGSPDLEAYLDDLKEHLGQVELMICLDSGALTYDRLWVTTSLRGMVRTRSRRSKSCPRVSTAVRRAASCRRPFASFANCSTASKTPRPVTYSSRASLRRFPTRSAVDARRAGQEFGDVIARELPTSRAWN